MHTELLLFSFSLSPPTPILPYFPLLLSCPSHFSLRLLSPRRTDGGRRTDGLRRRPPATASRKSCPRPPGWSDCVALRKTGKNRGYLSAPYLFSPRTLYDHPLIPHLPGGELAWTRVEWFPAFPCSRDRETDGGRNSADQPTGLAGTHFLLQVVKKSRGSSSSGWRSADRSCL